MRMQAKYSLMLITAIIFQLSLPQSKRNKSKNKQYLIKLESFCTAKETIDKMKTTYRTEKIFANDD